MSIQVPITPRELKIIKSRLRKHVDIVCLDRDSHVRYLLAAQQMLMTGTNVNAKIVKGYE